MKKKVRFKYISEFSDQELFDMFSFELAKHVATNYKGVPNIHDLQLGHEEYAEEFFDGIITTIGDFQMEYSCLTNMSQTDNNTKVQIIYTPIFIKQKYVPFLGWMRLEWDGINHKFIDCQLYDDIGKLSSQRNDKNYFKQRDCNSFGDVYQFWRKVLNSDSEYYLEPYSAGTSIDTWSNLTGEGEFLKYKK